jgi:hypothetical protein
VLFCFCVLWKTFAQVGENGSFSALTLSQNSYISSLGGQISSSLSTEAGLFTQNPALADSSNKTSLQLAVQPLWGQSMVTNIFGQQLLKQKITLQAGLQYFHYGALQGADVYGNLTNTFAVNDFVATVGASQRTKYISAGINLKLVGNTFPDQQYLGIAADIGGHFIHPNKRLSAGLVLNNFGRTISKNTTEQSIPFNVKMGLSFKPKYMGIRFHLQLHHLSQKNVAFLQEDSQQQGNFISNTPKNTALKKVLQHANMGAEILVHKNVILNFSFNQLIRSELKQSNNSGTAGLAAGILIQTKKVSFGLSQQSYHWAGGLTTISLSKKFK